MNKTVLCDANIWLDYFFGERPHHDSARRLILRGCRSGFSFLVPASRLSDLFYLSAGIFKRYARDQHGSSSESQAIAAQESAWAIVESLLRIATVVGSDMSDAEIALKFKDVHGDYEDDLVIAAALRSDSDFLITRNRQLKEKSPTLALDPDEALAYLGLDR